MLYPLLAPLCASKTADLFECRERKTFLSLDLEVTVSRGHDPDHLLPCCTCTAGPAARHRPPPGVQREGCR